MQLKPVARKTGHGVVEVTGHGECLRDVRPLCGKCRRGRERRGAPGHHIDERGPILQATGDRFGLVSQGEAAFEWAVEVELAAQRGEKTRPLRAVGLGKGLERRFDHVDPLGVDLPQRTEPTSVVGQCRRHQAIGVAELLRPMSRLQEGLAERGDARLTLGSAETDQQVDAGQRVEA